MVIAFNLKITRFLWLLWLSLSGVQGINDLAWAQEFDPVRPQVSTIRIGPHPVYTRILINLTGPVTYQVKPDFANKKITLFLPYTAKGPKLRGKFFNDKNLRQFSVRPSGEDLEVTFLLKNANTRLFHSLDPKKPYHILMRVPDGLNKSSMRVICV